MPEISIIVPVYNTGNLLIRCVDSVLCQSFGDYELLLIDDGSENGTASLCDSQGERDDRIRVFHKENRGQLHARVFGIQQAAGAYLMFLDSDDTFCENTLEMAVRYLKLYEVDFLFFGFQKIKGNKAVFTSPPEKDAPLLITDKRELYRKVLSSSSYNSLWRKVIRRSNVARLDYSAFYHLRIGEDLLQSMDFYRHTEKALFINDILYRYYLNEDSVTHSVSMNKLRDSFEVHEEIERFLQEEGLFTRDDYMAYHTACWTILAGQIYNISVSAETEDYKKELLRAMKQEPYVLSLKEKEHGRLSPRDAAILRLYEREQYEGLIRLCGRISAVNGLTQIIKQKIR